MSIINELLTADCSWCDHLATFNLGTVDAACAKHHFEHNLPRIGN